MGDDAKAYDSLKEAEPLTDDPKKLALLNKEMGFVCYNLKKHDEALARLKNAAAAGVQCDNCPALIAQLEQALAAPAKPAKKRKAAR
ncbi:MAG: hypothetical protein A3J79_07240 [Elusimicrobia bacterium RIFOXYB2_FULL_62_6]|nr:MAG: hypothetical protein A3J79_07240 [Elusimicrobia bacterium RIFOXYB2_FULL_62_6]